MLADPHFGPEHALFASATRLYGLRDDERIGDLTGFGMDVFPEDPLRYCRASPCFDAFGGLEATPSQIEEQILCMWGSVGHPNPDGAEAYAVAMIGAWESFADSTGEASAD
ncbi:MAG: hypothetical protein IID40_01720 [Planctomycetes bacterium]|nr:hypothetical protein [Planctomycetota bacterium]